MSSSSYGVDGTPSEQFRGKKIMLALVMEWRPSLIDCKHFTIYLLADRFKGFYQQQNKAFSSANEAVSW